MNSIDSDAAAVRTARKRELDAARARRYRARKRRDFVVVGDVVWTLDQSQPVEDRQEPDVVDGQELLVLVSAKSAYYMICACGRRRYAPAQCLHEVKSCRVCRAQRDDTP
jgi:hypothetical protein